AGLDGALATEAVAERAERVTALVDELMAQRAEERLGERLRVLVETVGAEGVEGRAEHQGPETDGTTRLLGGGHGAGHRGAGTLAVGDVVAAEAVGAEGVDLVARAVVAVGA